MTAAVEEPLVSSSDVVRVSPRARSFGAWEVWRDRLLRWKLIETTLLIWMAALLFHDRAVICDQYLFKYTDEDQAIMWGAAHDLLEGKIHEPCFWGQDYNSCLEGYVAAPLVAMGLEYNVAVPLATVMLGLLPFVLLALVAWWRGHTLVAAGCLLVPILMPVRYSIITGIPRGFVTGNALAILPTLLLLPPRPRKSRVNADGQEPRIKPGRAKNPLWLHRSWPAIRYFLAGSLAIVALQVNQSCAILLVPVAVYALLTSFREWKFWVFGVAGLLAAVPYPIYVYQFYHRYHDDYRVYMRGSRYDDDRPLSEHFSSSIFQTFYSTIFAPKIAPNTTDAVAILPDMVPIHVPESEAATFVVCAFGAVLVLLVIRRRTAAVIAVFSGGLFLFMSLGFDRLLDVRGQNAVSFPHARMLLSIPVAFVWMMFLVNTSPWQRFRNTPAARWLSFGVLVGLVMAAQMAVKEKEAATPTTISLELAKSVICRPIPIDVVYATAYEVQKAADATKADIVIVSSGAANDKTWAYLLPAITTCDTLYANYTERRTWRFIEENQDGRHQRMLFLGEDGIGTRVGGGTVTVDSDGYVVESGENPAGASVPTPAPTPGAGRGGRGGAGGGGAGGGRGGAGGLGGPGGPGGGRGRGGGRGAMETFGGTSPGSLANLPPTHTVTTPTITMVPITNNNSVMAMLRKLGVNVPLVHTPAPSAVEPNPHAIVERRPWG